MLLWRQGPLLALQLVLLPVWVVSLDVPIHQTMSWSARRPAGLRPRGGNHRGKPPRPPEVVTRSISRHELMRNLETIQSPLDVVRMFIETEIDDRRLTHWLIRQMRHSSAEKGQGQGEGYSLKEGEGFQLREVRDAPTPHEIPPATSGDGDNNMATSSLSPATASFEDYPEMEDTYGAGTFISSDYPGDQPESVDVMEIYEAALHHKDQAESNPGLLCKEPQPYVHFLQDPLEPLIFIPQCVLLHRCANFTGCCPHLNMECGPKKTAAVYKAFFVFNALKDNEVVFDPEFVRYVKLINHTECECKEKKQELPRCTKRCPNLYRVARSGRMCLCECSQLTAQAEEDCGMVRHGVRALSQADLVCIKSGACYLPSCHKGQFNVSTGFCPVSEKYIPHGMFDSISQQEKYGGYLRASVKKAEIGPSDGGAVPGYPFQHVGPPGFRHDEGRPASRSKEQVVMTPTGASASKGAQAKLPAIVTTPQSRISNRKRTVDGTNVHGGNPVEDEVFNEVNRGSFTGTKSQSKGSQLTKKPRTKAVDETDKDVNGISGSGLFVKRNSTTPTVTKSHKVPPTKSPKFYRELFKSIQGKGGKFARHSFHEQHDSFHFLKQSVGKVKTTSNVRPKYSTNARGPPTTSNPWTRRVRVSGKAVKPTQVVGEIVKSSTFSPTPTASSSAVPNQKTSVETKTSGSRYGDSSAVGQKGTVTNKPKSLPRTGQPLIVTRKTSTTVTTSTNNVRPTAGSNRTSDSHTARNMSRPSSSKGASAVAVSSKNRAQTTRPTPVPTPTIDAQTKTSTTTAKTVQTSSTLAPSTQHQPSILTSTDPDTSNFGQSSGSTEDPKSPESSLPTHIIETDKPSPSSTAGPSHPQTLDQPSVTEPDNPKHSVKGSPGHNSESVKHETAHRHRHDKEHRHKQKGAEHPPRSDSKSHSQSQAGSPSPRNDPDAIYEDFSETESQGVGMLDGLYGYDYSIEGSGADAR